MINFNEFYTDTLCCEPILRRMPNGELLCVCQCGGSMEPHPDNRVYYFLSADGGKTWSEKKSIIRELGVAVYCTDVSVINGVVTAYLTLHTGAFLDWKCFTVKSRDNGHTWEEAGPPPVFTEYTFLRGTIVLKNGNIVQAYQHYPVTKEEHDRIMFTEYPDKCITANTKTPYCESGVLISSDGGRTFERSVACRMDMKKGWIWSEPTVAELSDGSLVMLMRKDGDGWLWRCDSYDGGKTWTEAERTDIPNPTNKPKLISMDKNRIALLNTPNNAGIDENNAYTDRFPFEIWISTDNLKSFKHKIALIGERASYSYSDGFYENDHLLFTIEKNRKSIIFFDIDTEDIN